MAVRGSRESRSASRSRDEETRKSAVRMSESATTPATAQCSFEGDREDGGEEEPVARPAREDARAPASARTATRRLTASARSRSASSSARAGARGARGVRGSRPRGSAAGPEAAVQLLERRARALRVVGRGDDAGARLADEAGRRAVGRHGGQDRALGGEVLEHLPRQDALAAPAGVGDEQEQRLRVALQLERRRRGT